VSAESIQQIVTVEREDLVNSQDDVQVNCAKEMSWQSKRRPNWSECKRIISALAGRFRDVPVQMYLTVLLHFSSFVFCLGYLRM
jgi:hypothetical protein